MLFYVINTNLKIFFHINHDFSKRKQKTTRLKVGNSGVTTKQLQARIRKHKRRFRIRNKRTRNKNKRNKRKFIAYFFRIRQNPDKTQLIRNSNIKLSTRARISEKNNKKTQTRKKRLKKTEQSMEKLNNFIRIFEFRP